MGWWAGEKFERERARSDPWWARGDYRGGESALAHTKSGSRAVGPDRLGVGPDLQEAGEEPGGGGVAGPRSSRGYLGRAR